MKSILPLAFALFAMSCCFAQQADQTSTTTEEKPPATLGIGLGLDYGGIGARFNGPLSKMTFIQFGAGFNFNGLGFNGGLGLNLSPGKTVQPVIFGMYGYNTVLMVKNAYTTKKETYYGPSFGFALQFHGRYVSGNYFNLGVIVPVRNKQFQDDYDALKNSGADMTKPSPVTISLGYHFGVR